MSQSPQNEVAVIKHQEYAEQLDHEAVHFNAPRYQYRIIPQAQNSTTTMQLNATTKSVWNIAGDSVYNNSEGFITFDASFGKQGANQLNTLHADFLPIENLYFGCSGSQQLVALQNCRHYTKIMQAVTTPFSEFATRGAPFGQIAANSGFPTNLNYGLQPVPVSTASLARSNSELLATIPTTAYIPEPPVASNIAPPDAGYVASLNVPTAVSGSDCAGRLGIQRLISGIANDVLFVRFRINLKAFVGTLLAMDRDLCFGRPMVLTIEWAPISKWGFWDVAACNTAAANLLPVPTISNMNLYLPENVSKSGETIREKVLNGAGETIVAPYTYANSAPAVAGRQSITTQISDADGIMLKRAISCVANSYDQWKVSANLFNVNNVRFSSVRTAVNNKFIQDEDLTVADSKDWMYQHKFIKNSPAALSQRTFQEMAFYIDNFSDGDDSTRIRENDCKISGEDLKSISNYQATYIITSPANQPSTMYTWVTYIKNLVISKGYVGWGSNSKPV